MSAVRILIVDDDVDAARRLAVELEVRFGPTTVVANGYQALAQHADSPFDVLVLEVALPGASGIDLLERLAPAAPAVVLTWLVSPEITARALQAGAHAVLTKPCRIPDVLAAVDSAARTSPAIGRLAVPAGFRSTRETAGR